MQASVVQRLRSLEQPPLDCIHPGNPRPQQRAEAIPIPASRIRARSGATPILGIIPQRSHIHLPADQRTGCRTTISLSEHKSRARCHSVSDAPFHRIRVTASSTNIPPPSREAARPVNQSRSPPRGSRALDEPVYRALTPRGTLAGTRAARGPKRGTLAEARSWS